MIQVKNPKSLEYIETISKNILNMLAELKIILKVSINRKKYIKINENEANSFHTMPDALILEKIRPFTDQDFKYSYIPYTEKEKIKDMKDQLKTIRDPSQTVSNSGLQDFQSFQLSNTKKHITNSITREPIRHHESIRSHTEDYSKNHESTMYKKEEIIEINKKNYQEEEKISITNLDYTKLNEEKSKAYPKTQEPIQKQTKEEKFRAKVNNYHFICFQIFKILMKNKFY